MLAYRRFPLSRLLPSWWMAPWVGGLLLFLHILHHDLIPEPLPSYAQGIEWPVHDGGPCLGDVQSLILPPLRPTPDYQNGHELAYLPLAKLETARLWRTITFTGQPIADFMCLQTVEADLQTLAADTSHRAGVRVRFSQCTSYSCFFEVLVRASANSRIFWLDARHSPMTLYLVTFAGRNKLPPR